MATDREPWLINPSVERVDEYCEMLDGLAGATEGTHPNFAEISLRVVLTKAFHDGVRAGSSAALEEAAEIAEAAAGELREQPGNGSIVNLDLRARANELRSLARRIRKRKERDG